MSENIRKQPKSNSKSNSKSKKRYKKRRYGKSVLDGSPTLTLSHYWMPKQYIIPVNMVYTAITHRVPFNSAVDQVATLFPDNINRNKLAEHTLKAIANDYKFTYIP